jgi:hypothetical protein
MKTLLIAEIRNCAVDDGEGRYCPYLIIQTVDELIPSGNLFIRKFVCTFDLRNEEIMDAGAGDNIGRMFAKFFSKCPLPKITEDPE